jgi:hypothetical protein
VPSAAVPGEIAQSSYAIEWWVWIIVALIGAVVVFGWLIARKGRRLPGPHVFRASRFSKGNLLLPAQVAISPDSITLYQPQWIGKIEESIHLTHVSSIKIDTNLLFSSVVIESTGGHHPIVCQGHTKGDAIKMKKLIEQFQTARFAQ